MRSGSPDGTGRRQGLPLATAGAARAAGLRKKEARVSRGASAAAGSDAVLEHDAVLEAIAATSMVVPFLGKARAARGSQPAAPGLVAWKLPRRRPWSESAHAHESARVRPTPRRVARPGWPTLSKPPWTSSSRTRAARASRTRSSTSLLLLEMPWQRRMRRPQQPRRRPRRCHWVARTQRRRPPTRRRRRPPHWCRRRRSPVAPSCGPR